ncbi:MAG TPA: ribokinase [Pseudomonadales bacterium]|jgi:ribokinase|nr:ribokinase [Gammaproteobacteria bacterium]MDP6027255.1 ribokinase [Pseudomonadales bacterium]MDP6316472.1 ribokinase [Pseudomonadales bacterium]MDP7316479.1 ribokinase [Pseudomonadales bacterium]MDP7575719.1 ribokinase [Pseudomonadales bacterium]|tara:strand:- start:628 stop:1497 length:870 start_codon:yes stop_codon:yes gene_type:complete
MFITNFGSYCIDHVYSVPYFVRPGETLPSLNYEIHPGGKGLNQSLALAYAGATVRHAGKIGEDGTWMKTLLDDAGVDTSMTSIIDIPTGHANIQVTPKGENAIVIYGGANKEISESDIEAVLYDVSSGDHLLIQNEISCLPELIEMAASKEQCIIFNAAPITAEVNDYPLDLVEIFVVNEVEAEALAGESDPDKILDAMVSQFPNARTILTLGELGARYAFKEQRVVQPAYTVNALDSTGAGDTFTGYFLANYVNNVDIQQCLDIACKAASICVTRQGAASSIPRLTDF